MEEDFAGDLEAVLLRFPVDEDPFLLPVVAVLSVVETAALFVAERVFRPGESNFAGFALLGVLVILVLVFTVSCFCSWRD